MYDNFVSTINNKKECLYIGFENHQVAVYSKITSIQRGVERKFRSMLKSEPKNIIGRLKITWDEDKYHLFKKEKDSITINTLEETLNNIQYEVILYLINSRPDLLWFHAGAVAYQGKSIVVPGLSGSGKSTLITSLCGLGWTYLSDDVLPLEINSGKVIPFPRTPMVRENLGRKLTPKQVQELNKVEFIIKQQNLCKEKIPIGALVFPCFDFNSPTQIQLHSPANAALNMLQNCLNFNDHKKIALEQICKIIKNIPVFKLSFNSSQAAGERVLKAYESLFF